MSAACHKITSSHVFAPADGFPLRVCRHENHAAGGVHTHAFHELVILLGGEGTHLTDHGGYRIEAGDVFLIRGAMAHGYTDVRQMKLVNILFQPRSLSLPLQYLNDLPGYHVLFRIEPKLRRDDRFRRRLRLNEARLAEAAGYIATLEEELLARKAGYRMLACAQLMTLLGFLSRCYGIGRLPPGQRPLMRLGGVLSHMENHFDEAMTLKDMAAMAGMSESTFARCFRKVVGRSPTEHLIRLRMDHAKRLLCSPELNITEVAIACGFNDSNYFSRSFRANLGRSPREYRNAFIAF